MVEKVANPKDWGRRPSEQSRDTVEAREKAKLDASNNGELVDGKTRPFVRPSESAT